MRKNDAFDTKIVNTRLMKIFIAIFAPDERLPSPATLVIPDNCPNLVQQIFASNRQPQNCGTNHDLGCHSHFLTMISIQSLESINIIKILQLFPQIFIIPNLNKKLPFVLISSSLPKMRSFAKKT